VRPRIAYPSRGSRQPVVLQTACRTRSRSPGAGPAPSRSPKLMPRIPERWSGPQSAAGSVGLETKETAEGGGRECPADMSLNESYRDTAPAETEAVTLNEVAVWIARGRSTSRLRDSRRGARVADRLGWEPIRPPAGQRASPFGMTITGLKSISLLPMEFDQTNVRTDRSVGAGTIPKEEEDVARPRLWQGGHGEVHRHHHQSAARWRSG
jgi:hypothetical protein